MKGFNETKEIRIKLISGKMNFAAIEKAICEAYCLGQEDYERSVQFSEELNNSFEE